MGHRDASKHVTQHRLLKFRDALWVATSVYGLALTYFFDHFAALACVAFIPFFAILRKSTRGESVGYGLIWGGAYFTLFGLLGPGLSPFSFSLFVVIGATVFALLAFCLSILSRRLGFNPIALGLAWLIFEVIRIELILQFGTSALSQRIDSPALDFTGIVGLSGLSFLIVLVNVLLIRLLNWAVRTLRNRPGMERSEQLPQPRGIAFVLVQTGCYFNPEDRGPP